MYCEGQKVYVVPLEIQKLWTEDHSDQSKKKKFQLTWNSWRIHYSKITTRGRSNPSFSQSNLIKQVNNYNHDSHGQHLKY